MLQNWPSALKTGVKKIVELCKKDVFFFSFLFFLLIEPIFSPEAIILAKKLPQFVNFVELSQAQKS